MKIICIGRNYSDHIKELSNTKPTNPVVFLKPDSSIIAKNQNFIIPSFSSEIHHEVELVVKINKVGKHIDESFSNKYYNEIGLGIDFTARDVQNNLKQKGHPWEKSKAFDNSCLVGDFIVKDELENQSNIEFSLKKNNLIDKIISEPVGGAHRDRDKTFLNVRNAILNSYDFLKTKDLDVLVEERMNKFTSMGVYNS